MCGWPTTSEFAFTPGLDPGGLIPGLRRQPLLAVLRPSSFEQAHPQLRLLQGVGLCHVELAVQATAAWVAMVRECAQAFPSLRLGAASVRTPEQLQAVQAAGLTYAVSPILDPLLLEQARTVAITLVPGVFSPTEIHAAVQLGAPAVKLYPAASLGPLYWRSLAGPLGPLPFCIAAGGLLPADVRPWLAGGVDAVALGNGLFTAQAPPSLHSDLPPLLARLSGGDMADVLST